MAGSDKQKQSLYIPEDMLREIMRESTRLDRSLSWTVQQAWRLAREEVRKFPAVDRRDAPGAPARETAAEAARAGDDLRPSAQVREFLKGKFDHELTN
jgi:uncharacterized small protein (TIGR04563 family)